MLTPLLYVSDKDRETRRGGDDEYYTMKYHVRLLPTANCNSYEK